MYTDNIVYCMVYNMDGDTTQHCYSSAGKRPESVFTVHTFWVLCRFKQLYCYKSYCSTVHFRRISSIYQPTNAHIISDKTILKHFKTLRRFSILSDHQGALFLAKVILQYSQFNSYLQTRCCGSISCCVVE